MVVVSNTSPISNLAMIGRLNLLRSQFQEIKPRSLKDTKVAGLLGVTLEPGEAEAIALALELSSDLVLLAERDGRSAAAHAGLRVAGVLGVLLRAKNEGQIELLKPELDALRTRARFFLSAWLIERVLQVAGE